MKAISKILRHSPNLLFILIAVCSLSIISCDSGSDDNSSSGSATQNIDPNLQQFVNSFNTDMIARGIPARDISGLSLNFGTTQSGVAGFCIPSEGTVVINSSFANSSTLEELIYHELGHCILGMEHRGGTPGNLSIMQASGFVGLDASGGNRVALLDEFFDVSTFDEIDVNTSAKAEIKFF